MNPLGGRFAGEATVRVRDRSFDVQSKNTDANKNYLKIRYDCGVLFIRFLILCYKKQIINNQH